MSVAHGTLSNMSYSPLPQTGRSAGIVTTAELRAAGKSKYEIETLTRTGALIRLRYGVYADATRTGRYAKQKGGEHLLRAAAALAVVGADATVSHESAARLYDIDLLGKASNTVTLTCPQQHGWRGRTGVPVHIADLPTDHLDTKVRFRLTTPARTVVDLARTLDDFRAGVVTADCALHKKLTTKDELHAVLAARPRWRGIQRARQVVEFADHRAESPLESIARVVFANCGLPTPDLQVWLAEQIRVDFYWKKYRTVAEVDGELKYDLDPTRARAELARDRLLRRQGYEVVHLTWDDIARNPQLVAKLIREAFSRGTSASSPLPSARPPLTNR
jgi:hypothetical protein